ncbi:MAG: hypothetical protein QOF76_3363, partial [Solirubrobacteraceae bacterium]|nr:hypothetical protein [Solirubrobacteraceae bacterium]
MHLFAEVAAPAGGSPLGQVMIASAATSVVLFVLITIGLRRRAGAALAPLDAAERLAVRLTGLPGWSALPVGIAAGALITAVFGLYWDVSLHMDKGRDPGPLANPSHFFILGGLLGIFAAGWLASVMAQEKPGPAAVRISSDWYAPVGGLVMMACSSFAAIGFPLDDMWHRLFGQDVTLWGPTHMMMLTGAAFTLVGIMILLAEGRRAAGKPTISTALGSARLKMTLASGGMLIGLSIYQGEFDYGAPQFRLLYQPALIALAASCALVLARLVGGRGAAFGAAAFFILVRGALTIIVGPAIFHETVAHFPLFLAEAALVEGVAVALGTTRLYRFALVSGGLVGTVGVLAEYGWTHVWMPIAWPEHLLPGALAVGLPVALSGALIGAFVASSVKLRPTTILPSIAGVAAIAIVFAALNPTVQPDGTASV